MNLYQAVCQVLTTVNEKRTSLKGAVYSSESNQKKPLMKLSCEVLKYKHILDEIISRTHLSKNVVFAKEDPHLVQVLVYEHMAGRRLKCHKRYRKVIQEASKQIDGVKAELITAGTLAQDGTLNSDCNETYGLVELPRYCRINTLKVSVDDCLKSLATEGWRQIPSQNALKRKELNAIITSLTCDDFCQDPHFPSILIFSPKARIQESSSYHSSNLVLQDKSSCLATFALDPKPGSTVLDTCAAPGMKSLHLAALLNNTGQVFCVDKDKGRLKTLREMLKKHKVNCARVIESDYLQVPLDQLSDVEYALVDPPCSGSGMNIRRLDYLGNSSEGPSEPDFKRLDGLGNLQAMILKRTLKLESLKRCVYSTCSIYERENEMVIDEVLKDFGSVYELVPVLPWWKHRGRKSFPFGHLCLRASSKKDLTNGFFVAMFEKKKV